MNFQDYPELTYFYNPRYRFLYAPIPKSACSSIKVILYQLQLLEQPDLPVFLPDDYSGRSFHIFMDSNFTLSRLTPGAARSILQAPDIFRFTFVRHPLGRIASAYLNKFVTERYNSEQWEHTLPVMRAFFGNGARPMFDSVTFQQFVTHLAGTPDEGLDKHWCSQRSFLTPGIQFHIGRVEDFDSEFHRIAKRIGLPETAIHANRTRRSPVALPDKPYWSMSPDQLRRLPALPTNRQMYNEELEQAILRRYHEDISYFSLSD